LTIKFGKQCKFNVRDGLVWSIFSGWDDGKRQKAIACSRS
jgi:hypothetical protein